MTQKDMIREQLKLGLPEGWITDELIEAVAFARGNQLMRAYPEGADAKHAMALCRFAAKVEGK